MLKIVLVGSILLIGDVDGDITKSPAVVMNIPHPSGKGAMLIMDDLIGKPKEIELLNPIAQYDVQDEEVKNLYIKKTTGIVLANNVSQLRR